MIFFGFLIRLSPVNDEAGGATGRPHEGAAECGAPAKAGPLFALPPSAAGCQRKAERPWPRAGALPRAPSTAVESVPAIGEVFAQPSTRRSPPAKPAPSNRQSEEEEEEAPRRAPRNAGR